MAADGRTARVSAPSVEGSLVMRLLPGVLSVIAGSADIIGFLGLNGLFTAHITGNLILIAARIVNGSAVGLAHMLSVPIFILVLGLTRLLVAGLDAAGIASLRLLLLLQFLLLAGSLALGVAGPPVAPDAPESILVGMLVVSAMAVQNALVQISLKGAPSTAVMTTNVTRFMMDVGEVLFAKTLTQAAQARRRAQHTWPAIVGFIAGAGLGAACFAAVGMWSLALPTSLALLAVATGLVAETKA
ncbi:MAG TPA: YoaK family protein [Blastocatellia bacterium]|nr:YoaK family protein [Blastocatellia bacterium]